MVTPPAKREAVAHLQALLDVSEQRACRVIGAVRSGIRYQSRGDDDGMLRDKLRDLAHQRRRFRVLNVVDDVTRECLAAVPDTSISGK